MKALLLRNQKNRGIFKDYLKKFPQLKRLSSSIRNLHDSIVKILENPIIKNINKKPNIGW